MPLLLGFSVYTHVPLAWLPHCCRQTLHKPAHGITLALASRVHLRHFSDLGASLSRPTLHGQDARHALPAASFGFL